MHTYNLCRLLFYRPTVFLDIKITYTYSHVCVYTCILYIYAQFLLTLLLHHVWVRTRFLFPCRAAPLLLFFSMPFFTMYITHTHTQSPSLVARPTTSDVRAHFTCPHLICFMIFAPRSKCALLYIFVLCVCRHRGLILYVLERKKYTYI